MCILDVEGKTMNFIEAPKHCGYYASNDKDGKILLTLHLQSHCHMSMQASIDPDLILSM